MFRALMRWMDRDWAKRKYNPRSDFKQRLVWSAPIFLSVAATGALEVFGFARDSKVILSTLALGIIGMFALLLLSNHRWMVGYSRTRFQERAAAKHRARVAGRQRFFRRWFKPDSS